MHSVTIIDPTAPLRDWLRTLATVTAKTGQRVYAGGLPKDPTLPAISLFRVAGGIAEPLEAGVFQFDCWATKASTAAGVKDALCTALLSELPQALGTSGLRFMGATVQSVVFLPDPDAPDVHRYSVTAQVVTIQAS